MNNVILVDTREKGNKSILEYFESIDQEYIITKLDSADYMFYKDYSVLIDKKQNLLELAGNLCKTAEHYRINREIERAREKGCKRFIFLIAESKITCIDEVENWANKYSRVKGLTLMKIMKTMQERYGVEFIFCKRLEMGKKIIELLNTPIWCLFDKL